MTFLKILNGDEVKLIDAAACFYTRRSAAKEIREMTRFKAGAAIGPQATNSAFDALDQLLSQKPPENWPGLAGTYRDLIAFACENPQLREHLHQSGALLRSFRVAAQQVASYEKLVICSTFMEFAKRREAKSWHESLARKEGIPAAFVAATSSLMSYSCRPVDEFFRFADGDVAWSEALAGKGVFLRAIECSHHKRALALDLLQKAAGNPLLRQGLIESDSLAQVYAHFKEERGIVPFQIQCVVPWAQALWPKLPTPFAGAKRELGPGSKL